MKNFAMFILIQEWYDVRLAWANVTKYKAVDNIVASSENLWLPDMALQNR